MFSWNRWTLKNLVNLSWFTFNNSLFIMNDSSYGFNRPSLVRKGRWDHLSLLCQHDDCKRNAFIVDDDHHDSVMAMTFLRSLSQKGTYCNRLILQFWTGLSIYLELKPLSVATWVITSLKVNPVLEREPSQPISTSILSNNFWNINPILFLQGFRSVTRLSKRTKLGQINLFYLIWKNISQKK